MSEAAILFWSALVSAIAFGIWQDSVSAGVFMFLFLVVTSGGVSK